MALAYSCGIEAFTDNDHLASVLYSWGVRAVFDVRNKSEIQRTPNAGTTWLRELFFRHGMYYEDMSKGFSLDVTERRFLTAKGYVNMREYRRSLAFTENVKKLKKMMDDGVTVCLLGYHNDYRACHRFLLGFPLLEDGIDLLHLRPAGYDPLPQSAAEREKMDEEFPVIDQIALFDMPKESDEERRNKLYDLLNKQFGQKWLEEGGKPK